MSGRSADRFCIFCGCRPIDKNSEHPLPQWLLRYTGDPNRVVKHGIDWRSGRLFEFSWDSLKFPACIACNSRYASMESQAKPVVEKICQRDPVTPAEYVVLLDWLDKVRVSVWLGNRYLQGLVSLPRSFTVDGRIGAKDRMVAVYPVGDHQVGLNIYGAETRLFNFQPSVIALRVNNTLFLNASWDWMCAENCGYPWPKTRELLMDQHGMLAVGDFQSRRRVTHPIMGGLMKSCVLLFQPVLQHGLNGELAGASAEDLDYCERGVWPDRNDAGPLYRQLKEGTITYGPASPLIAFDRITDSEARRAIDIATQAYGLQIQSADWCRPVSTDKAVVDTYETQRMEDAEFNRRVVETLRQMSAEDFRKAYGQSP